MHVYKEFRRPSQVKIKKKQQYSLSKQLQSQLETWKC